MQKPSPRERVLSVALLLPLYLPFFLGLAILQARWFGWVAAGLSLVFLFWLDGRPFRRILRLSLSVSGALLFTFLGLFLAAPQPGTPLLAQLEQGLARAFPGPQQVQILPNDTGWSPPDDYTLQVIQFSDFRMEWLTRTDAESDRVILQLHGGAFIYGMNDLYREFAVRYSSLYADCAVATPDYRLSPDYPYPCQQEDTMNAWRYLTDSLGYSPQNIVVVGDSAGGNLALSLGLRLRNAGEALPAGFVCMSPWADLTNSGPSHVYNATNDPSFGISVSDAHGQSIGVNSTYADGLDANDPEISPSFGDYYGFPPILLQVGSIEVLRSDSEMVYDNAKAHGVDCTLTVYSNMFHVFQGALDYLPQSRLAWEEVGTFLNRL